MVNLRQNKGFALVFSLVFFFLVLSLISVYIFTTANGIAEASRLANAKKAYYVADAGLADAYERIAQAGINVVPTNPNYIPSSSTDNGVYSVGTGTGSYTVSVVYSNVPRSNYTITSTGTYGNVSKTLQLTMIGAAISKYAYWSQTEIHPIYGPLWWITGMLTTGPIQTNGTLNIYGNPIFDGPVAEVGSSPNYWDKSSTPSLIFPDGLSNKASQINLPAKATLNAINAVASDGQGLVLTGSSMVVFDPTGTITVTGTVKNALGVVTTTYNNTTISPPSNGVIYVQSNAGMQDGNVTVQGTVKGQLTVAADQNVFVSGDVAYNTDPRNPGGSTSTDLVALVANQSITVVSATAPANLEMAGILVALQGSFQVDNPWISGKGNMDQFGSLINNYVGITGIFDPTTGTLYGGWNQIQSYDTRLATVAPPGFPPYINNAGAGVYNKVNISEL